MNWYSISLRALSVLAVLTAAISCSASSESEVDVESGQLRGALIDDVFAFKGIPFAAPPVGELRWKPPQPAAPWDGIRSADAYGPTCAQRDASSLWFDLGEISEDCLMLNVWTKTTDKSAKLPVMVSIHGGGFLQGSGNIARQDGLETAKQDVVFVTVNYRLAMFGFLTHPALEEANPDHTQGNYGLQDIQAALEWVQRNISAFGGDPGNVTIFGTSAGADAVNTLMVMPGADGLFHRAISESGSTGLAPVSYIDRRAGFTPSSDDVGKAFIKKTGAADAVDVAEALYALSMEDLIDAMSEMDRFTPVVDGEVIPGQLGVLFAEGKQHRVPYITGANSYEAALGYQVGGDAFSPAMFAKLIPADEKSRLYSGLGSPALEDEVFKDMIVMAASRYLATQMRQSGAPVYSYYLSYVAEDRRDTQPGAAHGDDVAFVLQTLEAEKNLSAISEKDRDVSKLMSAYWVQFAKTGNPNREGLPEWPAFEVDTAQVLDIGDDVVVRDGLFSERMAYHIGRSLSMLERVSN